MSTHIYWVCDRCGKKFEDPFPKTKYSIRDNETTDIRKDVDLCEGCQKKLDRFMNPEDVNEI